MQEIQMNGLKYEIFNNLQEVEENKKLYAWMLAKFAKDERLIKSIEYDYKTYYLANGAIFCGCNPSLNTEFNKYGKILFPDGGCYIGEIKNGKMEGNGEYKWPNGESYKGNFKNGKMDEYGEYEFPNGEIYKGSWQDGEKNYGEYEFPNGDVYWGQFKGNAMDGYGEYKWENGAVYKGYWKDDKKEGYGEYKWENGAVYKGYWKDDKKEGRGIYTEINGQQLGVLCIDDIFVEEKLIQQVPVETGNGGFFGWCKNTWSGIKNVCSKIGDFFSCCSDNTSQYEVIHENVPAAGFGDHDGNSECAKVLGNLKSQYQGTYQNNQGQCVTKEVPQQNQYQVTYKNNQGQCVKTEIPDELDECSAAYPKIDYNQQVEEGNSLKSLVAALKKVEEGRAV
ncbi:MORN repeat-containing protein [Candidatus Deianiraea vastatrix]|uniref:MORN repeat protein n=1 Tax=Candidatus Deianiraea vastatrix TaxID=2163644 RepID=A0A5B8XEF6_9RICK|nr:hypothetical protein [Candidatus Deianiraea vastatrix]QED23698.1 Putative MORN repeat protein [Candidatus Deianiraea vastatrix]